MKVVILDSYTSNPGDLSWDLLHDIADVTLYDRTEPSDVVKRTHGAEVVLTNKVVLDAETLMQLPDLKYIGVLATGFNIIDIDFAQKNGILVTNIPGYSTDSVAQLTFSFILAHTHSTAQHSQSVHRGDWSSCQDFSYWNHPLVELSGKTLGVIGYGAIAQKVITIGQAFNMRTIVHTRTIPSETIPHIQFVSRQELFAESDYISLHCPLTDATKEMINGATLKTMKSSAFIINTGRGPLVDEKALADALQDKTIAGAGLDVLTEEPPSKNNPLLSLSNCIITPHFGWATVEARKRLIEMATNNISAYSAGTPINVVNS
ncbi:MAG: D-2-hydroxyacid dehydrogenase [Fibrobacterales bacterium]